MHDIPYDNSRPASHYEHVIDHLAIKRQAFAYMNELSGWCSEEKASVLIDLIIKSKPKVILEIGVFGGKSLVPMAYALKINKLGKIYGIDPWDTKASIEGAIDAGNKHFWAWVDHESILQHLIEKIEQFDLYEQIELIKSTSEDAEPIYGIDILHIDGNHSDAASYLDVTKWAPYVQPGGVIIFDDINIPWKENGVCPTHRAVEWLNVHCSKMAEFSDQNGWGVWIKQ